MTIEENGQPAGLGPMSEDAAADLLVGSLLEEEEGENATAEAAADNGNAPADDQTAASEGDKQPGEDDPDELSADDLEDNGTYYDIDKLDPDMTVRLRDGTTLRWGDLKRDLAEARELQQRRQEIESRASQFQQEQTRIAQQRQYLEQVLPQAIQVLKTSLPEVPPMPDPALAQTDFFAYQQQLAQHLSAKEARAQKEQQIQQLTHVQRLQQQELTQRQQQEHAAKIQREHAKLIEAMPILRDEGKRREFMSDVVKYAREVYGATEDEISQIDDHRTFLIMRDAIAYRKLLAKKPKVQAKVQAAPPVQKPGKRQSESEQKASAYNEQMQRLRKTGSMDDAAELILKNFL